MMKKTLLSMACLAAGSMTMVMADSEVYVFDCLGSVDGVSDNGRYAAVTDTDNGIAYLWSADNPGELVDISEEPDFRLPSAQRVWFTVAHDVSDDGTAVGCIGYWDGHQEPAYYQDGVWHRLPMDPNAFNTNEAVAITPDGSVIAGYHFLYDSTSEISGRYYPCQWFRQEDGSYELKSYSDITLPNHQGFMPYTQSVDGRVVAGMVYCGVGSTVNGMIKDGEFVLFDEVETRREPFIYQGKYYAGWEVGEDGVKRQLWLDDPDDPRVEYYESEYINGYADSSVFLESMFADCDINGNIYGSRTRVENVTETGEGDLYTEGCVYNYLEDTWTYEPGVSAFSTGLGEELLFTREGDVMQGDDILSVREAYGIDSEYMINGIARMSRDGKTLGGVASEYNEANGELMYHPFMVLVDGGTSAGVQCIAGNPMGAMVIAVAGRIEVLNASKVAVYDLNGRVVGDSAVTSVTPGVYVVNADGRSYKISVR